MKNKQATPYNFLKKLYAFTNKQSVLLAFKRIISVHNHIFSAIQHDQLQIAQNPLSIDQEIAEYKKQNRLEMDEDIMLECVSVYDIFLGKEGEKQKLTKEQKKIIKRQQFRNLEKEKSQNQLIQKQLVYNQKIKEFQKQKQILEEKKKLQQLKKLQQAQQIELKQKTKKQKELQRQREEKKKKLQEGLKEMEQKRQKRKQMIKELEIQNKRSQSMKTLGHSVPKYIQLEKEYLEMQRKKIEQMKQFQKKKRQSMQLKIQEINHHEKQYIQKLKEKFTSKGHIREKSDTATKPSKAKSDFNTINYRDQEDEQKFKEKAQRRKQFEAKLKNIPIHIDVNKKKEKQIEIDKAVNKQKYMLLAKRHLDDDQIFSEFKDFEIKIDPRNVGKNYLNQLRSVPKAPKSQRLPRNGSEQFMKSQPPKHTYANYLEELKAKSKSTRKSYPQIQQNDELLRLLQNSKKVMKKHQESQQINIEKSRVSMNESLSIKMMEVSAKVKENDLKKSVSKTITEKIEQYERKVLKKVKDLKKISQYDQSLKNETEIDDLFSKVLKAKIHTIGLT